MPDSKEDVLNFCAPLPSGKNKPPQQDVGYCEAPEAVCFYTQCYSVKVFNICV